jgi:hypothetical protein
MDVGAVLMKTGDGRLVPANRPRPSDAQYPVLPTKRSTPEAATVLADSAKLAKSLVTHTSTTLQPILDEYGQQMIPSWRSQRVREHVIHQMMPRVGGFPAGLARYLIAAYTRPGETVLDPYCGKGTALLEAIRMGRQALGGDVAFDAVIASRAKCSPVSISQVVNYIQELDATPRDIDSDVPAEVRLFYHRRTLAQLLSIRKQLLCDMENSKTRHVATFVCGVLLGLLHGHSQYSLSLPCNQCFAMSPRYVRRYVAAHGLKRPARDVKDCLMEKSLAILPRPKFSGVARIFEAPAVECAKYGSRIDDISLILTSPPYLNRQTYAKDGWLRLWFLDRSHTEVVRRSTETGSITLFVEAMKDILVAAGRVLRVDGIIAVVGGEARATVRGATHVVNIADLCAYACANCDASTRFRMEQVINDPKIMTRGSYFAVYAGKHTNGIGPRGGQDKILVIRKLE